MNGVARRMPTWAVAVVLVVAGAAWAQQVVPPPIQAAIFARALAYDRALKSRVGPSLVLGVLTATSEESASEGASIAQVFDDLGATIQGLTLRVVTHPYQGVAELEGWATEEGIDIVYVCPGLANQATPIRDFCRDRKLVSLCSTRKLVEDGLALGVVLRGDNPGILVNYAAATAVGMELDPKLLQLSEVLR